MNKISLFLAWRYAWGAQTKKKFSLVIKIAFISIFFSSFACTLILSILAGFQQAVCEKLQGMNAQIVMHSHYKTLDYKKINSVLSTEFPEVSASAPHDIQHGLLQVEDDQISTIIMLKGIIPEYELRTTSMGTKIEGTSKTLPELLHDSSVVIGGKLAEMFDIKVGTTIRLLYAPENVVHKNSLFLAATPISVAGFINTGIEEIDASCIICHLSFLESLFSDAGAKIISLKLQDGITEKSIIKKLASRFKLNVMSWQDMYPALVSALTLERYVAWCIILLLAILASVGMAALMLMYVLHKRSDIAILRAMGCTPTDIYALFLLIGSGISTLACVSGLFCAYIIALVLKTYPIIKLPDSYYVSHLPVVLSAPIFLTIFIALFIINNIALLVPLLSIKNTSISRILRAEVV